MKTNRINLYFALLLAAMFVLWTAAVCVFDVGPIAPNGSWLGFASINGFVHNLTGVHMSLYMLTDWLGLVPVGFAVLGITQWIRRKGVRKVDYSIFVLGVFYVVVMGVYVFFEKCIVNYRPVLINGFLEASYPSSTTMLVCDANGNDAVSCPHKKQTA